MDKEIEAVNQSTGLRFNDNAKRLDSIHYSSIPWVKFTALNHAKNFNDKDSVPKITFGKMYEENGQRMMSISVEVHHGFADGYHVSTYIEKFQKLMNELSF